MATPTDAAEKLEALRENFALIVPYYAEAFKLTEEECSALEAAAAERFCQRRASSSWAAVMCVVDAIDAFCSRRKPSLAKPAVSKVALGAPLRKAA